MFFMEILGGRDNHVFFFVIVAGECQIEHIVRWIKGKFPPNTSHLLTFRHFNIPGFIFKAN